MKQRIISGVVMFLLCLAVLLLNGTFPPVLNIVMALISAAAVFELAKAVGLHQKWHFCAPALAVAAAVPFCGADLLVPLYFLFTVAVFGALLASHRETTFKETAVLYSMTVLIPMALRSVVSLRDLDPKLGICFAVVAFLTAWLSDIGAFFAGTFFGRHKLCPEISPKKTVEGALGGLVFNAALLLVYGVCIAKFAFGGAVSVNYLSLLLAGVLGTPVSILGDLSFSLIKRGCGIKDFGHLIPGHGGILDRFDSVIFTAPFIYLLCYYLPFLAA